MIETRVRIVGKERQVEDIGLDEILEKVGAEGHLGREAAGGASDFDQHLAVIDVGVADRHAQSDVARAPTSGPDEDEGFFSERTIEPADGVGNVDAAIV